MHRLVAASLLRLAGEDVIRTATAQRNRHCECVGESATLTITAQVNATIRNSSICGAQEKEVLKAMNAMIFDMEHDIHSGVQRGSTNCN
jgi:hypothetical protein